MVMDILFQLEALGVVIIAAFLGAVVGYEREQAKKSAGLRTHVLVSSASALLVILGQYFITTYQGLGMSDMVSSDPIRILQSIIIGISFIGGGVIFNQGKDEKVRNLTTATSILFVSAIGIGVALRLYVLSTLLALFVVATARLLLVWEKSHIHSKSESEEDSHLI